jgi:o-aminophenol oxidase
MPVRIADIRKALVFTGPLQLLTLERLDLLKVRGVPQVQVRMSRARHRLHPKLGLTELWTYDGLYPGKVFVVRADQEVAVEWVNEINGTLPVSVISSGYVPLDVASVHPQNEPGRLDGGKDQAKPVPTDGKEDPVAKALPAWTVVHLHGARVAPDSDGWTENAFLPRGTQTASQRSLYPPQPRAMMLWYHDHAYTITRLNVFSGLAGGWIIRDPEERALRLPADECEMALIIQDRNLETAGEYLTGKLLHKVETDSDKNPDPSQQPPDTAEFFGPFTLVNGSLWPTVDVRRKPYRLRLLNGSNARTYQLFLVDDANQVRNDLIRQIGTDAGLLCKAVPIDGLKYPPSPGPALPKGLTLAPAERADLIVDFQCAPGRTLRWVNVAAAPFDGVYAADDADPSGDTPIKPATPPDQIRAMGDRLPYPEVMQFVVDPGKAGARLKLPDPLAKSFHRWTHDSPALKGHTHRWLALNEKVEGTDKVKGYLFFNELVELDAKDPRKEDFTIRLAGEKAVRRFLNRRVFFRSPINFYPAADGPEVWRLVNFSADTHPIHLHLVDFQPLSRHVYKVAGSPDESKMSDAVDDDGLLKPDPTTGVVPAVVPDPKRPNDPARPDGIDDNEAGWKDTVRVNPNEIVTIGMVFKGFTGRFMYHCHILEHEDMDMMRPMVVVPPQVKPYVNEMMMMAGDESDMGGMPGMPGMSQ